MQINEFIIANEPNIRLGCFFAVLLAMALWELIAPRRKLLLGRGTRWPNNLGLVVFNTLLLRLLFPAAAVGFTAFVAEQGWGLLNYYTLPPWLAVTVSLLVMDLVIYLQHVMVHAVPLLWRLHRVHHADPDYDFTTGSRFHPIEIILSMLLKMATISVLGPPLVAVIVFEIVLNAASMFNHGNVRIPQRLDRVLRWLVVTPDMHRVHHSVNDDEANSNFGFNLPWWDRLFGTYRAQPRAGHEGMTIGIHKYRANRDVVWLTGMLSLPFKGEPDDYTINRRNWNGQGGEGE